jgi:transcriptional regulator with PAS, ATPase and Fis domain
VLEEKQITPVGGEEPREIDFRLVSATSSDLESMIEEGEFREDLFYRINVFEIEIPPLRERIEDVEPLCEYFLDEINQKLDSRVNEISDEAMALLKKHDWPGNVRELRNALESAVVVADGDVLAPEDFDLFSGFSRGEDSVEVHAGMSFEDAEAILIEKTLDAYDGNITRSAEQLGVTRKTLRNKRDEYDIDVGNN